MVDVPAVADGKDDHRSGLIVESVQDAISASSRAVPVCQGWAELFPDAVRVLEQRAGDELERGGGNGFGEVFGEVSTCRGDDPQLVMRIVHAEVRRERIAASRSSWVSTRPAAKSASAAASCVMRS